MTAPVSVTTRVSIAVSSGIALSARSTSTTAEEHVGVFNLAVDGGPNNAALNVVSINTAFSACEVTGQEFGHGTLKISHVNAVPTQRLTKTRPPSASTLRPAPREAPPPRASSSSRPPAAHREKSSITSIPTA